MTIERETFDFGKALSLLLGGNKVRILSSPKNILHLVDNAVFVTIEGSSTHYWIPTQWDILKGEFYEE